MKMHNTLAFDRIFVDKNREDDNNQLTKVKITRQVYKFF